MNSANPDTHVLLRAFADELARCGLRAACTSPGSRSTPLVLALVREPRLQCFSHLDERCAGFFAVGLARASARPVVVACTSGTAAAELAPAVIEAWEAGVPLIVLTADRPPELRDVGAGQTIDQLKLFGRSAKWFFEVGTHQAGPERMRWVRALACRAYWTAEGGRPGPVHLNWPLREPLVPAAPLPDDFSGRPGGRPWILRRRQAALPAPDAMAAELAVAIEQHRRGVIVAGRPPDDRPVRDALRGLAERAGQPLLADPLSGARSGPAAIGNYDALLRDQRFAAQQCPDLVIRIGDLPTSRALRQWLAGLEGTRQLTVDPHGAWSDPDAALGDVLVTDPAPLLEAAGERLTARADGEWLESWTEPDRRAQAAIDGLLGELSEPWVARELGRSLPAEATLFVASSMPIRDVESFWGVRAQPPRVLANRGANGIDGTVSAAFGAAAANGGPVVLLIGDVALAHDIGGLLAARRLGLALCVVLLNNDGGGIFDFLPVSSQADVFEEHIATPHGLDFNHAAALYGIAYEPVAEPEDFRAALGRALGAQRTTLIEVRSERALNVALHRTLWASVSDALASAGGPPRGSASEHGQ